MTIAHRKWGNPNGPAEMNCPWCTRGHFPPTEADDADCTCVQWCGSPDCTAETPDPDTAALIGAFEAVSAERDDARAVALMLKKILASMPTFLDEIVGEEVWDELPDWFTDEDNGRSFWGGGDA
ncbi:hypothetical protein Caci_2907 [Catenulispora acidiphila DSM 44928]|uniref:Uncharacterized protein n=1 Tax=Catenulispora acidiphila (strain DSM 44928 / JCM 14897 / NBRC 102108 / NRRL B-24433 / ID139908) TaxID=479433 RepID=C7Q2S4_CATAD|nr:hypothetical protein [Catenulispora acidiphila]ACU71816.1 hypothetical protein Caci_2907 [Catenulispora acidiphila DSM 44928]